MEFITFDSLSVCAYADAAHTREKELWRGFLSYSLPSLLALESSLIDEILSKSIVYNLDDLKVSAGQRPEETESFRAISGLLAQHIGLSIEFGIAAFLDGHMPTKLHKLNTKNSSRKKIKKEDNLIARWLLNLSKVSQDRRFLNACEQWRSWLDKNLYHQAS